MYMLKICRCCDAIVGELDSDDSKSLVADYSVEVIGNVAYTLCSKCMRELDMNGITYYQ
jgi:hypothetical protein